MTELDRVFETHHLWQAEDSSALFDKVAGVVRAVATTGERGLSAAEIVRLPDLEIVACFGVGVDAIDYDACMARGISITNTPGVLSKDVADLAVGLMLMVIRRMLEADRYVRDRCWLAQGPMRLGRSLQGLKLGILGMGRIGLELARRARAFDIEVAYCNRRRRADVELRYFADLVELARWSDILVLTLPGGEATRHLVNQDVLRALGPQGVLINVARGSVVDQKALVDALMSGGIAAAGLDVFEDEPHVPDALIRMPNVVLQPHQASATDQTRDAMANLVVDNLKAHFAGEALPTRFVR